MGLFRRVDIVSEAVPESAADATAQGVPIRLRIAVEEWPALRLRYGFQVAEIRPEGETFRNNAISTYNAFSAAVERGVSRVVWASSETVLGLPFDQPPAFAPIDRLASEMVRTWSPSDTVELIVVDPDDRIVQRRARIERGPLSSRPRLPRASSCPHSARSAATGSRSS